MKKVENFNGNPIYALTLEECKEYGFSFPCYAIWSFECDIGDLSIVDNTFSCLSDCHLYLRKWG